MYKFRCIVTWHFPSVLLVFTTPLMGKLNFRGYLISPFYHTCEFSRKCDAREKCFIVFDEVITETRWHMVVFYTDF